MPNYVSLGGIWVNLSDSPASAATEASALLALPMSSWSSASLNTTEAQKTDSSLVCYIDASSLDGILF